MTPALPWCLRVFVCVFWCLLVICVRMRPSSTEVGCTCRFCSTALDSENCSHVVSRLTTGTDCTVSVSRAPPSGWQRTFPVNNDEMIGLVGRCLHGIKSGVDGVVMLMESGRGWARTVSRVV